MGKKNTKSKKKDPNEELGLQPVRQDTIDLLNVARINNDALDNLKAFQSNIPDVLKPLNDVVLSIAPKLADLTTNLEKIELPKFDTDFVNILPAEPQPIIGSFRAESQIIEQQQKTIEMLHEILDEIRNLNTRQRSGIKNITKQLNELVAEERINVEVFELMKRLCLEWFGEDELPESWR